MDTPTRRMGNKTEIDEMEHACKKRDALQQEITRREPKMRRRRRHRQQLEIILAWRDPSRYIKANRGEIKYARHHIGDLDKP